MQARKVFAGDRLRRLRLSRGITQAALARALSISPSYLNQIERDQRPLTRTLADALGARFEVDPRYFADDADERLVGDVREAAADPSLPGDRPQPEEVRAAVRAAPLLAARFVALQRAYAALAEQQAMLLERIAASALAPMPGISPYDEVRDWVQSRHNHFDRLDRLAEQASARGGVGADGLRPFLVRHFRDAHGIAVEATHGLLGAGTIWRLDRRGGVLHLAAEASDGSRLFWMAHVLGLIEHRREIDREVRGAGLVSAQARALARVALANYFAGALLMPYGPFLAAAQRVGYDIERLQGAFGTSFEQVCHRLSTLQDAARPGIPFYFCKTDIAGNVLKRSSATRFRFARFGGPCPLWNVYRAFAQPGRVVVQVARTPDDVTYLNVARTVGRGGGSYLSRPRSVAVVLGCEVDYAARTVYARGLSLADPAVADPIGPGCRACERADCRHRALPPLDLDLEIGTHDRGVVPYRILPDRGPDRGPDR